MLDVLLGEDDVGVETQHCTNHDNEILLLGLLQQYLGGSNVDRNCDGLLNKDVLIVMDGIQHIALMLVWPSTDDMGICTIVLDVQRDAKFFLCPRICLVRSVIAADFMP